MGKVLESILATHISYLVETYDLLPSMHIEGRKSQSSKEVPHKIVEKIYRGWNKDQVAFLLILDILRVYDYIC